MGGWALAALAEQARRDECDSDDEDEDAHE
jgi:hypothetical protein